MIYFYLALIFFILQLAIYPSCAVVDRPFYFIFTLSTAYYGILGPCYWAFVRDYDFVGVDWYDGFWRAPFILVGYGLLTLLFIVFLGRKISPVRRFREFVDLDIAPLKFLNIVGVVGAIYLAVVGIGAGKGLDLQDPFLLIAYQFADLLIAIYLLYYAAYGWSRRSIVGFCVLTVLAILVGYRYRLVFLWGPLIFVYFSRASKLGRFYSVVASAFVIFVFSLLTIARKKFEGIDLDVVFDADLEDFLYGLFAESNNVFGLLAILNTSLDAHSFVYLTPVFDAFADFVPRFFYPEKSIGEYVGKYVALGLVSNEGFDSGTAYPYVGEYLMMGGYFFAVLGTFLYASLYLWLRNSICKFSTSENFRLYGIWLISIFFGYYYYSRGFLPQVSKTFLFIVFPYVYLLMKVGSRLRR